MKVLIVLYALLASINAAAQIKIDQAMVQYVGSSVLRGSSDAVIVGNVPLVHTKQFLPLNGSGAIVGQGNVGSQLDQVFENISKSLKRSGSGADQIIKLNVFLTNTDLIPEVQSLISRKFNTGKKPSVTLAIGELAHPDALISIDAIAVSKLKSNRVRFTDTKVNEEASSAILPAGPVVYVSGQAAKGDLAQATRTTLKQLSETLSSLGLTIKDVVQIKSFLTPMSSLNIVKKEFTDFFKGETIPPLVFVDWISADPVIEIELIASSPIQSAKGAQVEYITPPGMAPSPVYSKVSRLNYGKKVYLSGLYGVSSGNTDSEVNSLFGSMGSVLGASGSDFNNLLKATYYISNEQYSKSLGVLRPKYYDPKRPPAASKAMLKGIGLNGAGISVDMIGTVRE
ncbi:RidA family protein [Daejeonella sp.]|uniref:RidA family protein n=1 Tax=Daejeonella sp. TaxID=2805397 RepID=UPI0030BAE8A3